jgi:hypothetical protein
MFSGKKVNLKTIVGSGAAAATAYGVGGSLFGGGEASAADIEAAISEYGEFGVMVSLLSEIAANTAVNTGQTGVSGPPGAVGEPGKPQMPTLSQAIRSEFGDVASVTQAGVSIGMDAVGLESSIRGLRSNNTTRSTPDATATDTTNTRRSGSPLNALNRGTQALGAAVSFRNYATTGETDQLLFGVGGTLNAASSNRFVGAAGDAVNFSANATRLAGGQSLKEGTVVQDTISAASDAAQVGIQLAPEITKATTALSGASGGLLAIGKTIATKLGPIAAIADLGFGAYRGATSQSQQANKVKERYGETLGTLMNTGFGTLTGSAETGNSVTSQLGFVEKGSNADAAAGGVEATLRGAALGASIGMILGPPGAAFGAAIGAAAGGLAELGKALVAYQGDLEDAAQREAKSKRIEEQARKTVNEADKGRYGEDAASSLESLSFAEQARAKDEARLTAELEALKSYAATGGDLEGARALGISTSSEGRFSNIQEEIDFKTANIAGLASEREKIRSDEKSWLDFSSSEDTDQFKEAVKILADGMRQEIEARIAEQKGLQTTTTSETPSSTTSESTTDAVTDAATAAATEAAAATAAATEVVATTTPVSTSDAVTDAATAAATEAAATTTPVSTSNEAMIPSNDVVSQATQANTEALLMLADSVDSLDQSLLTGIASSSFGGELAPDGDTYLESAKKRLEAIRARTEARATDSAVKSETTDDGNPIPPVNTSIDLPADIQQMAAEVIRTGQSQSKGYDLRNKEVKSSETGVSTQATQPSDDVVASDYFDSIRESLSALDIETLRSYAQMKDPSLAGSAVNYMPPDQLIDAIINSMGGGQNTDLQSTLQNLESALSVTNKDKSQSFNAQYAVKKTEMDDRLNQAMMEVMATGKSATIGFDLREPQQSDCCDRIVAALEAILAAMENKSVAATTAGGSATLDMMQSGLGSLSDGASSWFNSLFGVTEVPEGFDSPAQAFIDSIMSSLSSVASAPSGLFNSAFGYDESQRMDGFESPAEAFTNSITSSLSSVGGTITSFFGNVFSDVASAVGIQSLPQMAISPLGAGNSSPAMLQSITGDLKALFLSLISEMRDAAAPSAPTNVATGTGAVNILTIDEKSKQFLESFQKSIDGFGGYVSQLSTAAAQLPDKIEFNGNYNFNVNITGAEAFERMKVDLKNEFTQQINTEMTRIWSQTGGGIAPSPNRPSTNAPRNGSGR